MEAGSDDQESEEDDEADDQEDDEDDDQEDDEADDQEEDESEDQEDDESEDQEDDESDDQEEEELISVPENNNLAEKKKSTDEIQKALKKAEKAERIAKLKANAALVKSERKYSHKLKAKIAELKKKLSTAKNPERKKAL